MIEPYVSLYQHDAWAEASALAALESLPEAAADATIQKRLRHAHVVQRAFLTYLEGEEPDLGALRASFESLEQHRASVRAYHERALEVVEQLDPADLDRRIAVKWFDGKRIPVNEILLQATMHSHYHRGQNMTRLRELGGEPPTLDFIVWTVGGRPAPRW